MTTNQDGQVLNTTTNTTSFKDKMAEEAQGKTKELMNKIKSAIDVWTTQNENRAPELNDLLEMLKPNDPNEVQPGDPRILHFKIYFGRNSESPLFYFDPTTNGYFSTQTRQWGDQKPEIVDYLNERDIGTDDVFDAILHGVIDDEDYEILQKMNLIDGRSKQLWEKLNKLYQQTQEMQKSLEAKIEEENIAGKNVMKEIMSACGVTESDFPKMPDDPPGENLVEQIKINAMSPEVKSSLYVIDGNPVLPQLEERVRAIVKEEISLAMGQPATEDQKNTSEKEAKKEDK